MKNSTTQKMDSVKIECSQDLEIKHIIKLLKDEKNIDIIVSNPNSLKFDQLFHAIVEDQSYSIQIIKLLRSDHQFKTKAIQQQTFSTNLARQQVKINHPNILSYINDFQIENYHFIIFEDYYISLQDWINLNNGNKIKQDQFIRISLEILEATKYLHDNNYVLKDLSLKNIFLDKNLSLKIQKYGESEFGERDIMKNLFQDSLLNEEIFYLPPEYMVEQLKKPYLNYETDIWKIGICLYSLAGANTIHILNYIQSKEPYQIQQNLDCYINSQLINILQKNPNQKRPSVSYAIQYFKNLIEINKCNSQDKYNANQHSEIKGTESQEFSNMDQIFIQNLIEGINYFNQSEYNQAAPYFKKCLEINPINDIPYYYIAKIYNIQSEYELAQEYGELGIKINSSYDYSWHQIGNSYYSQYMYEQTIQSYNQAIQINKQNDFMYYNLANLYFDIQNYEKAILNYLEALKIDPTDEEIHYNLGNSYFKSLNYDRAVGSYKKAIEINPKKDESYNNLGQVFNKKSMNLASNIYHKKAYLLNPKDELYPYNLSISYRDVLKLEKAIAFSKIGLAQGSDFQNQETLDDLKTMI